MVDATTAGDVSNIPTLGIRPCALCKKTSLVGDAMCLKDKNNTPVCYHKFCRDKDCMDRLNAAKDGLLVSGTGCPACAMSLSPVTTTFTSAGEIALPKHRSQQLGADFFDHVNVAQKDKRIRKEEVAMWIESYFVIELESARDLVDPQWKKWDTENRWTFGGLRSAKDGALDREEFDSAGSARDYLDQLVVKATDAAYGVSARATATSKRPSEEIDQPRNVRQRTVSQTFTDDLQFHLLLGLLREGDGKNWFDKFDADKDAKMSKDELLEALVKTLVGQWDSGEVAIVVENNWPFLDNDDSGFLDFDEFQRLRVALLKRFQDGREQRTEIRLSDATEPHPVVLPSVPELDDPGDGPVTGPHPVVSPSIPEPDDPGDGLDTEPHPAVCGPPAGPPVVHRVPSEDDGPLVAEPAAESAPRVTRSTFGRR